MKLIILVIMLSSLCFAETATTIKKGDIASFDGVLITEDKAQELYKAEKKVLVLSDLRLTDQKIIEYYKSESKQREYELKRERFDSSLKAVGFFLLGSIMTGLAAKVAIESTR